MQVSYIIVCFRLMILILQVRENIIALLSFILLYIFSYFIISWFHQKREQDGLYETDEDAKAYRCVFKQTSDLLSYLIWQIHKLACHNEIFHLGRLYISDFKHLHYSLEVHVAMIIYFQSGILRIDVKAEIKLAFFIYYAVCSTCLLRFCRLVYSTYSF